jgi:uncharacterized protein (TIGR02246 family)
VTADEDAITAVVDQWMEATRRGDLDTILSLMTDDVVFMVPGSEPFGKARFAEMSRTMKDTKIDGTSRVIELKVMGNWAFVRNLITLTITPEGGNPLMRSGYTLTLLRKNGDGKWKLARDANLVGPAK